MKLEKTVGIASMALQPSDRPTLLMRWLSLMLLEIIEALRKMPNVHNFFWASFISWFHDDEHCQHRRNTSTMASKGLQSFSRSLKTLRAFSPASKDPLTVCRTHEDLCSVLRRISSNALYRDFRGQWQQRPQCPPKYHENTTLHSFKPPPIPPSSCKVRFPYLD
jgi:hypothetical protein